MKLLQHTADTLIKNGIAQNYSDFSARFCKRTPNFFYRQKFFGRDFPTDALLQCLLRIREANLNYDKFSTIFETEQTDLSKLEAELSLELIQRWNLNKKNSQTILAILSELH